MKFNNKEREKQKNFEYEASSQNSGLAFGLSLISPYAFCFPYNIAPHLLGGDHLNPKADPLRLMDMV